MSEKKSIIELLGITEGSWEVRSEKSEYYPSKRVESIRCKNFNSSDLMADYRGNIIVDFKESHGERPHAFKEAERNANLIAAAPELLGALIRIVNVLKKSDQALLTDIVKAYGFDSLEAIEKACFPLKWTEIKELLNG